VTESILGLIAGILALTLYLLKRRRTLPAKTEAKLKVAREAQDRTRSQLDATVRKDDRSVDRDGADCLRDLDALGGHGLRKDDPGKPPSGGQDS